MLAREPLHVRRGGVDEMIDEADALGEAQHAVGQAIADVARNLGRVAQFDERLEQAHDGRARQAGFLAPATAIVPCGRRLSASRIAKLRRTGSMAAMPRRYSVIRILSTSGPASLARRVYAPPKKKRRGNMFGRRQFGMAAARRSLAAPAIARAQKFPSGRVTMVVPFPAGAATDISARVYAERLSALWGQPVVIDNKGGGNGIPAAEVVARAKPDGLTIFATSAMTQVVNPAIYDKLPYDPIADFEPITRIGTSPFVLLVDRNSPIKTAAELTAKLKAEPGKHNYGAGALPARVASELYKMAAGVDAVYVGYKSNPQAIPDVQSGLLTFMMIDTVNAKIADRPRRAARACSSPTPSATPPLPDVPTAAEAGLARRPADDLDRLLRAQGHAARDRRTRSTRYPRRRGHAGGPGAAGGAGRHAEAHDARTNSPPSRASEKERWGKIIRRANIKVE